MLSFKIELSCLLLRILLLYNGYIRLIIRSNAYREDYEQFLPDEAPPIDVYEPDDADHNRR
jgi:hypothetical protein